MHCSVEEEKKQRKQKDKRSNVAGIHKSCEEKRDAKVRVEFNRAEIIERKLKVNWND